MDMRKRAVFLAISGALFLAAVGAAHAEKPAEVVIHDWLDGSFGGNGGQGEFAYRVTKEGDEFVYQYEVSNSTKGEIHLRWRVLDTLIHGEDSIHERMLGESVGLVIPLKSGESKMLTVRSAEPPVEASGLACIVEKIDPSDPMWKGVWAHDLSITKGDPGMWLRHLCGTLSGYVPRTRSP